MQYTERNAKRQQHRRRLEHKDHSDKCSSQMVDNYLEHDD